MYYSFYAKCRKIIWFLKRSDKLYLSWLILLLAMARAMVLCIPFKHLVRSFSKKSLVSFHFSNSESIAKQMRILEKAALSTPWESKCLVQAICAKWLLNHHKIKSSLHLGVRRGNNREMLAHAWLNYNGKTILGATENKFTEVGVFKYSAFHRG